MCKLQELKEKQAKELMLLELEETINKNLGLELDLFVRVGYKKDITVFINLSETKISNISNILKKITSVYKPTRKTLEIDYKGKLTHQSPFLLSTQSNIKSSDKVILNYSSVYDIRITLPVNFYSDDVLGYYNRSVTSSEYHYFGGVSMAEIKHIKITKRAFDIFKTLNYYGGDTKCIIEDKEDLKAYNFLALNGHTEEFAKFWKEQKEQL